MVDARVDVPGGPEPDDHHRGDGRQLQRGLDLGQEGHRQLDPARRQHLAKGGDGELAEQDDAPEQQHLRRPDRDQAQDRPTDQDLVGDGVEDGAGHADHPPAPRQPAVEEVRDGRDDEGEQDEVDQRLGETLGRAGREPDKGGEHRHREHQPQDRQQVGDVFHEAAFRDEGLGSELNPLIPANAGTQMTKRGRRLGFLNITLSIAPYDLGPGIRRDERRKLD